MTARRWSNVLQRLQPSKPSELRSRWRAEIGGVGLAVLLLTLAVIVAGGRYDIGPSVPWITYPPWSATLPLLAAVTLPVATRKRWPLASLAVSTIGLLAIRYWHVPEVEITSVALFVCFYSAGRWGAAPARTWVRAGSTAGMAVLLVIGIARERQYVAEALVPSRAYYLLSAAGLTANVAFVTLSWLLGDNARKRAERERELAERTAELVAEREVNARRAVISERLRIARELHDVVAHHVSVMGLHAGAARRIGAERPEEVEPALLRIEQASRDAVAELHRLLGFLRQEDQEIDADRSGPALDGSVPLPGLDSFDVLRRQVAAAGLAVSLTERGQRRDLAPAVDLSAYRILQESLTNVLRHAGVDRAEVTIDYRDDALHLTVADRGRRRHPTGTVGSRSGIVGMRERAALIGGTLRAGPRPGGGFLIEAVLPTTAGPTPP